MGNPGDLPAPEEAARLLEELLADQPKRLAHALAVGRHCRRVAERAGCRPSTIALATAAAYLHDVGEPDPNGETASFGPDPDHPDDPTRREVYLDGQEWRDDEEDGPEHAPTCGGDPSPGRGGRGAADAAGAAACACRASAGGDRGGAAAPPEGWVPYYQRAACVAIVSGAAEALGVRGRAQFGLG